MTVGFAVGALAVALVVAAAPSADAVEPFEGAGTLFDDTRDWVSAESATIRPGVRTYTRGGSRCTANFVYTDASENVYLGQAAHCSQNAQAEDPGGCGGLSLPLGTEVDVLGTGVVGRMVYNSWLTMREGGERDVNACAFNDLALVQIPREAANRVNPTVPVVGGPTGVGTGDVEPGTPVLSYGDSAIDSDLDRVSLKVGTSLGTSGEGWTHRVYTVAPGLPGDSGSAVLDARGFAVGDLSTLAFDEAPLSNQVSDLAHQVAYAQTYGDRFAGLRVAAGTEPFLAGSGSESRDMGNS
ncbi:MAG: serine protease [Sporichthyaceae bacterium]